MTESSMETLSQAMARLRGDGFVEEYGGDGARAERSDRHGILGPTLETRRQPQRV